ncbi:hypothetical protein GGR92_004455 [Spirosoma lacussanchae]
MGAPLRGYLLSKRDKLLSNNAVLCATIFIMVWIETESPVVIETTGLFIGQPDQGIDNQYRSLAAMQTGAGTCTGSSYGSLAVSTSCGSQTRNLERSS